MPDRFRGRAFVRHPWGERGERAVVGGLQEVGAVVVSRLLPIVLSGALAPGPTHLDCVA